MGIWWRAGVIVALIAATNLVTAVVRGDAWPVTASVSATAVVLWAAAELWRRWTNQHQARKDLRKVGEPVPVTDPALLLHPARRVVPFLGRQDLLDDLTAWCRNADAEPLRLVIGPGGSGKSRLAIELAEALGDRDWESIPVRDNALTTVVSGTREARAKRVLLIIDYAETRNRDDLLQLLEDVAAEHDRRVRVLLLARQTGDWWTSLAPGSARVRQMITAANPGIDLADHPFTETTPEDVVQTAIPKFAARLGVAAPSTVQIDLDPDRPYRVLDLHATALVVVLNSLNTANVAVTVRVGDVLEALLGHEQRFWAGSLRARPKLADLDGQAGRIVAAATLLPARDRDDAITVLERLSNQVARPEVAAWVRDLYPPQSATATDTDLGADWWGPLQPDRLAELHITHVLTTDDAVAHACLFGLDDYRARHAWTLLAQAAHEHHAAIELLSTHLPGIIDAPATTPTTLIAIDTALPETSTQLAELHHTLTRKLLDNLEPNAPASERARLLNNIGFRASALGRYEDALPPTQEAVGLYLELAERHPDRHQPDLATALNSLSIRLAELGRHEEALPPAQAAVEIRRELAKAFPDRYQPELAGSLNNLGIGLAELGRYEDALPPTQEAVGLFQALAEHSPDRHRPNLAVALQNLGDRLAELGQHKKALPPTQEAVNFYGQMAERYPDRYWPDLARALNSLGLRLAELGRYEEALPPTQEAVYLYGELAKSSPDRHLPRLATALHSFGARLTELARHEEALRPTQEALSLYRELAERYPGQHRPDLAGVLNSLGNVLASLVRHEEALPPTQEAVYLYGELAKSFPDQYRRELAVALQSLGVRLGKLARHEEALSPTQEAVGLCRELATRSPDRYRADLAGTLNNLAIGLTVLGRYGESLPAIQESVGIYRELADRSPDRYRPNLAASLRTLIFVQKKLGTHTESESTTEESQS